MGAGVRRHDRPHRRSTIHGRSPGGRCAWPAAVVASLGSIVTASRSVEPDRIRRAMSSHHAATAARRRLSLRWRRRRPIQASAWWAGCWCRSTRRCRRCDAARGRSGTAARDIAGRDRRQHRKACHVCSSSPPPLERAGGNQVATGIGDRQLPHGRCGEVAVDGRWSAGRSRRSRRFVGVRRVRRSTWITTSIDRASW